MASTEITYGPAARPETAVVERGDIITVHTATGSITGPFVSLSAAKGVRITVDGKYVTRRLAAIESIEFAAAEEVSDEDVAAELPAVEDTPEAAVSDDFVVIRHAEGDNCPNGPVHTDACPAPAVVVDMAEVAARVEVAPPADPAAPAVVIAEDVARPAVDISDVFTAVREELTGSAEPVAVEGAVSVAEVAATVATDVFDADPIVDGRRLSEMKFPEVMLLAKRYRTPGRGVARIAALREGVAKAIHAEVATKIAAAAALKG